MTSRYQLLRVLGRGGMGEVQLVFDQVRQQEVARKRILARSASAMLRFKREFRVIEQLLHPGLIRLYELGEDDDGLYFTMEAIDGVDLGTYCSGGEDPPFSSATPASDKRQQQVDPLAPTEADALGELEPSPTNETDARPRLVHWERLVHVLPQILEALAYLHSNGIVHRDLKPGNIMVRRDGVAKLLDFGVLGELGRPVTLSDGRGEVVGTVGYMAPEQLMGEPPTPASDLYALGAILFELASGRPVFDGTTNEVISRHLAADPPPLRSIAPDVHVALEEVCAALLRKQPEERPTIPKLARKLLLPLGARRPIFAPPRPSRPSLVGREPEQELLLDQLSLIQQGAFQLVALCGPTGAGKTTLAEWLAAHAEREGMTVLRGRGRPSERVPFNAVDGCIDGLAMALGQRRHKRPSPTLVRTVEVASSAFPVLALKSLGCSPRPGASRAAAFNALAALLSDEGQRSGGIVLLLDDFQWADEDAVALLDHVARTAPASVLVVTTLRDDVGETSAARWLHAQQEIVLQLPVSPLAAPAVEAIVTRCARSAGANAGKIDLDPETLRRAVAACAGHPYLAELAGRALGRSGTELPAGAVHAALTNLVAASDESSRDLLALLIAADQWTPLQDLASWSEQAVGPVLDAVTNLEHEALVRVAGPSGAARSVDLYHSAVREAAMNVLSTEQIRGAHGRIAAQLEADRPGPPQRLVRHLIGAGRERDAAKLAPEAAQQAEAQRAFALAADLYEIALRHPGGQRETLLRRRAAALERGAQYTEAAACWRQLAEASSDRESRVDAALHEAHALLAAGDQLAGRRRLDLALADAGDPTLGRGGLAVLAAGLGFLLGPGRTAAQARPDPLALARAERDVRLGQLVGYFEVLSGIRLLRRARRGFVRAGAAEQAAWCDYVFAYFALFGARRRGPVPLAERYIRSARSHVEGQPVRSPEVRVMPRFLEGVAAQRDGRWSDGIVMLDQVADELDREGIQGTFEHLMVMVHRAQLDLFAQNLSASDRSLARLRTAAQNTDDSAMRCHLVFCEAMDRLLRGELQQARELIEELAAEWQVDQPSYQRFIIAVVTALPQLYLSDCRQARQDLAAALKRDRAFRPMKTMYGGLYGAVYAMAEANALRSGDRGASARRCRRFAALAEGAAPMWTSGAWRARAYAADATGHPERALELLERAEQEAGAFEQRLDLAIARYQRGRRVGGDKGAELVAEADRIVEDLGGGKDLLEEDAGLR